jgi:aromatic-L-amino-acid decarboxylase
VAVVAARSRYLTAHPETKIEDLVIYSTTQTHSLAKKAAVVLGLGIRSIAVKTEEKFSLRGGELRAALEEDTKLGKKPFIMSAFLYV